jgi:hypothetical protein
VFIHVEDALTSNPLINFFRPALDLPPLGEAVSLRAGACFSPMTLASGPKQSVLIGSRRKQLRPGVWPALADSSAALLKGNSRS